MACVPEREIPNVVALALQYGDCFLGGFFLSPKKSLPKMHFWQIKGVQKQLEESKSHDIEQHTGNHAEEFTPTQPKPASHDGLTVPLFR